MGNFGDFKWSDLAGEGPLSRTRVLDAGSRCRLSLSV